MELTSGLGDKAIQDVMRTYPEIGEILARLTSAASPARWASAC